MNMFEAVKSVLSKYVKFTGRARRSEFWYWCLALVITSFIVGVLSEVIDMGLFSLLFSLVIFFPGFAVSVRRLHDTGRTGWWLVWFYLGFPGLFMIGTLISVGMFMDGNDPNSTAIMLYGLFNIAIFLGMLIYFVVLLVFFCRDSQSGPNRYGDNPKNVGNFDVFS